MATRPDSDFEQRDNDDEYFPPRLLYQIHTRTNVPTDTMKNSRRLLMALAKSTEPLSESALSDLTSLDRHTIRGYCFQFLDSELIAWKYVQVMRHTEKMHWLISTGKSIALAIALEDNQLSDSVRKRLLADIVNSIRPLKGIRQIHALNRGVIHLLYEQGHYDILFMWNTHTVRYLRNNAFPQFWDLTWLSFLRDLNDKQLRQVLRSFDQFGNTLATEPEKHLFDTLVEQFMPIPLQRIRKLTRSPDLAKILKWHPELKAQMSRLYLLPDYDTIIGSVIGVEIPPELIRDKGPLQFRSKANGQYLVEKATPEGMKFMTTPVPKQIYNLHPELKEDFRKLFSEQDFDTANDSLVSLEIDPKVLHERAPLKLTHKGHGKYLVEKAV